MRFLRATILAIGFMSFAMACGGGKKEAAEPMQPEGGNVCGATEGAGGEEGTTPAEGTGEEGAPAEGGGEEGAPE